MPDSQAPEEPKMMSRINPKLARAFGKALKTVAFFIGIVLVMFLWMALIFGAFHVGLVAGWISVLALAIFMCTIFHYTT